MLQTISSSFAEPVFKDCPRDLVKINASPDSAYAILTINFKAVNYNGRELGIQGPTVRRLPAIHARVPKNMNIHSVTVNSNEDEYGHFATCNFRVLVKGKPTSVERRHFLDSLTLFTQLPFLGFTPTAFHLERILR